MVMIVGVVERFRLFVFGVDCRGVKGFMMIGVDGWNVG